MTWGPFSPTVRGHQERACQLRSLAALVACHCGSAHPLVGQLRRAESDPMAFVKAQDDFDRLPSLTLRRILSTFQAITYRHSDQEYDSDDDVRKSFEVAYEAIRERVADGGPGWTPKPGGEP